MPDQSWQVNVIFTEEGDRTRADAVLELASGRFHGYGQSKRAPGDPSVPVIGQDLAAARVRSPSSVKITFTCQDWSGMGHLQGS